MKRYEVWQDCCELSKLLKSYPFKIQAIIYCFLNGFVNDCGRYGYCLDDSIRIVEVNND